MSCAAIFIRVEFLGFLLPAAVAVYAATGAVHESRAFHPAPDAKPAPLDN